MKTAAVQSMRKKGNAIQTAVQSTSKNFPEEEKHMRNLTSRKIGRGAAVGAGIVFLAFLLLGAKDPGSAQAGLQTLREMQDAFHVVAAKVVPTVVEVRVVDVQQAPPMRTPFNFRNNPNGNNNNQPRQFRQEALGSGVIIQRAGDTVYVLTNNHVAGSAAQILVRLSDKREFTAKLVGKDENKDLALVSFTTKDPVPVAELGDSDAVQVGDWALAIGNPLGFTGTITAGIVSAVGRDSSQAMGGIAGFTDYLQTDAAVNQGNSGGALVDIEGRVIGINTWIASPSGGNVGLGFAIPINNAKKDIRDFISKGKVEYGWMGVTIGDASATLAKDMGLGDKGGAFVSGLFTGGPADKAGILPGDTIVSLDKSAVKNSSQLLQLIGNISPGTTATLGVARGGKMLTIPVTFATRSDEQTLASQSNSIWPGFSIEALTSEVKNAFNLGDNLTGLAIIDVARGTPADKAGLRQGDVVTALGGKTVRTGADFYSALNAPGRNAAVNVNRDGNALTLTLTK
jgi:Do/DeqQ family serine protease